MKKRVFIGVCISKETKSKALEWGKRYHFLPVRWVKAPNLHITIVPPFMVEVNDIPKIVKILSDISMEGFKINFYKVSLGPNVFTPRLIWAVGHKSRELELLRDKVSRKLSCELEKRDFLPHVTLARFNKKDFSRFPVGEVNDDIGWIEHVDNFTLFESNLSREGASYKVLHKFFLK